MEAEIEAGKKRRDSRRHADSLCKSTGVKDKSIGKGKLEEWH